MGDTVQVDPAELEQPARRFEVAGDGMGVLVRAVRAAAASVAGSAGNPTLAAAADVYGQGTGAVLDAFGQESRLLGQKIRQAGVNYRMADATAMQVQTAGVPQPRGRQIPE